jgi:DNA polymerase
VRIITVHRDYDDWRARVRSLLAAQADPATVLWQESADTQLLLLPIEPANAKGPSTTIRVPRDFADLAWDLFHHRDPERFPLLYRILWRLTHGERNLLKIEVDDDVRKAILMQRQVRWDTHRMAGFVRFEKATDENGDLYLAWYRPDHYVLELAADSFVRRFGDMRWSILTPNASAHWNKSHLWFGPGVPTRPTTDDHLVSLWQTYYASTYNPQRDNPSLFRKLVPTRFLRDMPEASAPMPRPGTCPPSPPFPDG